MLFSMALNVTGIVAEEEEVEKAIIIGSRILEMKSFGDRPVIK